MSPSPRPSASRLFRPPAAQPLAGGATLSPELSSAAASRLGGLALLLAAVSILMQAMERLLGTAFVFGSHIRLAVAALTVGLSLALYVALARGLLDARRALAVGLGFEVVIGLLVSVGFHAASLPAAGPVPGWPPVAVWAILYPLVVPTRPRRVALATLATVAMDPLGLWICVAAGAPLPPLRVLGQMLVPTALACVIAPLAAGIVYGLTVEVKKAREMGAYRLVERLGQGGMGEVWRAQHRMLARPAAIKLIRPAVLGAGEGSHAGEMVKRFEREAQATATLRSPHTIAVYDYGVAADGTFHYVMELLEGFSLQALVERFGPVPPERVVSLLRQACHSLAEAHEVGLVHRDVKPANLFVCRLGRDVDFVKVLDFGLVKVQGPRARGEEELTVQGALAGTPAFIAPEAALGVEPIDGRADIYALGCVAYWLLTGQRVFESASPMQMVVDHVRTAPQPPSRRAAQAIPADLEALVLRCLEKDPERRPRSAVELSRELEAVGVETQWTEERARAWWKERLPEGRVEASAPADLDDQETRSMPRRGSAGAAS